LVKLIFNQIKLVGLRYDFFNEQGMIIVSGRKSYAQFIKVGLEGEKAVNGKKSEEGSTKPEDGSPKPGARRRKPEAGSKYF
jgi:hypothetical protein